MLTSNLSGSNGKERTSLKNEPRWPAAGRTSCSWQLTTGFAPSFSAAPKCLLLAVVTVLIAPNHMGTLL
jgi:hypothetical protein